MNDHLDQWSENIISWQKKIIAENVDYEFWLRPLWCVEPEDVWVDSSWWINIARRGIEKYPNDLVYLEILLEYLPNTYREIARNRILDGFYHGICDPEDWYRILSYFYPELTITHEVFEDREYDGTDYTRTLNVWAWQKGYEPARSWIEEDIQFWIESLDDDPPDITNIYGHTLILLGLGKKGSEILFPPNILRKFRSRCLVLCKSNLEEYWDLVRIATVMEWYELLEALENNPHYFKWLFEEKAFDAFLKERPPVSDIKLPVKKKEVIEYKDFQQELLAWSLTPHKQTTRNLAYIGIQNIPEEPRSLVHFAMAIAWKRARSPIVFGASNQEK